MKPKLDPLKLFHGVEIDSPVIVAVSGGSDSIALLLLAAAWSRHTNANLQIVTIDHGLRPEAAAEAAFVAGVSEGLDLMHVTLAWEGMKPDGGISQAARNARYRLLEEFAKEIGAGTIITGHTANDQAETILMRNARLDEGNQGRGLSGIAPLMLLPGRTKLKRPLLDVTREDLRAYLRGMNQSWIEDPTNMDDSYERVRVRKAIGNDLARVQAICQFGKTMGRYRRLVANEVSEFLASRLRVEPGPVYCLDVDGFQSLPESAQSLSLQVMIAIAGGVEFFVSGNSVKRMLDGSGTERLTVGNAVVERYRDGIRVFREKRNLPALMVGPGDETLWDGRFVIKNGSASSYFCGALSFDQLQEIEQTRAKKLDVRPRAALGATPCLRGDGDDLVLPLVGGFEMPARVELALVVRSIEYFCPEYDFALLDLVDSLKTRMGQLGLVK